MVAANEEINSSGSQGLSISVVRSRLAQINETLDQYEKAGRDTLSSGQQNVLAAQARDLRQFVQPPAVAAFEMALFPTIVTAVRLGIALGIFVALACRNEEMTAEQLAELSKVFVSEQQKQPARVDAQFIARIMRVITLYGFADEVGPSKYRANGKTRILGCSDSRQASLIRHIYDISMPLMHYAVTKYHREHGYTFAREKGVRGPYQHMHDVDIDAYENWLKTPDDKFGYNITKNLNNFMSAFGTDPYFTWFDMPSRVRAALEECKLSPGESQPALLVDVGGGNGRILHGLRQKLDEAGIEGFVLLEDRSQAVPGAREAGMALSAGKNGDEGMPGVQYVIHDFFKPHPPSVQKALFYYVHFILHNWTDGDAALILRQIAAAMAPYSALLINERVLRPTGNDLYSAGLDFQMAYGMGGQERTLDEFRVLLEAAGMKIVNCHDPPDGSNGENVIECVLA